MSEQAPKPFRVAIDWLVYAHEHETSQNSIARELMSQINQSPNKHWVNIRYAHQVQEIVSAAGLYTSTHGMDHEDDKATARQASAIVKRGKKWLSDQL